jgi:pimeloyl-ACP methyl ester carboxylesterase
VIVFVHGVPETAAFWDKLRSRLDRESVALSLPGFGTPRPAGFGATKDDYAGWLRGELQEMGEPVDLVGHDWGAGLTYRIASAHGELVRSWVADLGNAMHPDYEWHDLVKLWQKPGGGEAYFQQMAAAGPAQAAQGYVQMGVPADDAQALVAAVDPTMVSCILDLFRSAMPNPHRDWNDALTPTKAPGLVLHPARDPFGDEAMARAVASELGARFEVLEGLGHFWALQGPEVSAAALERFWASLDL